MELFVAAISRCFSPSAPCPYWFFANENEREPLLAYSFERRPYEKSIPLTIRADIDVYKVNGKCKRRPGILPSIHIEERWVVGVIGAISHRSTLPEVVKIQ